MITKKIIKKIDKARIKNKLYNLKYFDFIISRTCGIINMPTTIRLFISAFIILPLLFLAAYFSDKNHFLSVWSTTLSKKMSKITTINIDIIYLLFFIIIVSFCIFQFIWWKYFSPINKYQKIIIKKVKEKNRQEFIKKIIKPIDEGQDIAVVLDRLNSNAFKGIFIWSCSKEELKNSYKLYKNFKFILHKEKKDYQEILSQAKKLEVNIYKDSFNPTIDN